MLHAVFFAESTVLLAREFQSHESFGTQQPENCGGRQTNREKNVARELSPQ